MRTTQKTYVRFSLAQRIEHLLLLISFTTLAVTGLPQKFPLSPISQAVVQGLGGIESIRIIHRVAATMFLLEAIYHLVAVGYGLYVRRRQAAMLPTLKDAQDALQMLKYNLGLAKDEPKMDRFNFVEKAEYWAMVWGLVVMAVTGFMLWNPIATTKALPGVVIPAAKIAHGGEAVLAVLAIILWHFYHAHIRRFNKSMFTGKIEREAMLEEHALELERIESGKVPPPPPLEEQRRRAALFAPLAFVFTVVMLGGVYWFVTFEESAITTIPPVERAEVFVPATATPTSVPTPTATPAPTKEPQAGQPGGTEAAVAWEGDLEDLFKTKCSACHGAAGGFSAESYADVLKGITPGSPDDSLVYTVQSAGKHPGQFSDEELARVRQWIEAGAPEQGGGASSAGGGAEGESTITWTGVVKDMLSKKCGACHGTSGGYSVKTYADAVKQVKPGDPDGSRLVEVMQGNHPRKLSEEELTQLVEWIRAGAPEE